MVRKFTHSYSAVAVLCMAAALGAGCTNSGHSAILAHAPGSNRPMSTTTPTDGEFALYRVTKTNTLGQPLDAKIIARYHLPRGEPIGFRWVTVRADAWHPNASLQLQAFAGDHVDDVGPITTMIEKYYWANPAGWDHYWVVAPAIGFEQRVTLQN